MALPGYESPGSTVSAEVESTKGVNDLMGYRRGIIHKIHKARSEGYLTKTQTLEMDVQCARLLKQIKAFNAVAENLFGDALNSDVLEDLDPNTTIMELDNLLEDNEPNARADIDSTAEDTLVLAESMPVYMPSTLMGCMAHCPQLDSLVKQEVALRHAQASDALQSLRLNLGEKLLIYRTVVRNAKSQAASTRSRSQLALVNEHVRHDITKYHAARTALQDLGLTAADMEKLPLITPQDLKMSGDVYEENRVGGHKKMAWFWYHGPVTSDRESQDDWMRECKSVSAAAANHH
jgi:hypothetical protein